jgi:hypothetical protein
MDIITKAIKEGLKTNKSLKVIQKYLQIKHRIKVSIKALKKRLKNERH